MHQETVFAFDFDNTISRDPEGFLKIMEVLELRGHVCYVVTARLSTMYPEDLNFLKDKGYRVFFTELKAKRKFMEAQGIDIDVWVDDKPGAVLFDYKGAVPYTYRDMPQEKTDD